MTAELRIGDTEREAAVAALGEHFAAGRLTKEEFDERTAAAWTARTSGAMAPLFDDLPAPHATPDAFSTAVAVRRPRPVPWSRTALRRPGPLGFVPLVALLVVVVATPILGYVVAILAGVLFAKMFLAGRHRSRSHSWHHDWQHRPQTSRRS